MSDTITRLEVARRLGVHPDSVSRSLHDGLGAAVVEWGGRSKVQTFDAALVARWHAAKTCVRDGGRPCVICRRVLDDCGAVAEHLMETRHGVHAPCDPDVCGYPGTPSQPCRPVAGLDTLPQLRLIRGRGRATKG